MAVTQQAIQNDVANQFDKQRNRAFQQENVNRMAAQEALKRRAAALPGAPGGAFIKQEQMANDDSANRLAQANEGIDAAQNAELRRLREVQQGQDFGASEAEKARQFQSAERLGSQSFQQANIDKQLSAQAQQQAFQNKLAESGVTGKYGDADTMQKQTFDYTKGQDAKEYEQNTKNNVLATIINLKNSGYSSNQISGLLQNLGIDKIGGINANDIYESLQNPAISKPVANSGRQPNGSYRPRSNSGGIDMSGVDFSYLNNRY